MGQNECERLVQLDSPCTDPRLPTPGRSIAGIDGCKRGWVMVRRDDEGQFEKLIVGALYDLPPTDFLLIDIPIGLPDSGRRNCDVIARRVLGSKRGRSVFSGARRPLLSMKSRECAHVWGRKQDKLGVNMQLWAILPKMREADCWIRAASSLAVREGHPELSFYAVAGRPMEHNKKTAAGRNERLNALTGFVDEANVHEWLDRTRGAGTARDDILDSLALCRSVARLALDCHCTLPSRPPRDAHGLAMEMVF